MRETSLTFHPMANPPVPIVVEADHVLNLSIGNLSADL